MIHGHILLPAIINLLVRPFHKLLLLITLQNFEIQLQSKNGLTFRNLCEMLFLFELQKKDYSYLSIVSNQLT